jgi:histidinol phosphatase-like PHP family hydrolase
VARLALDVGASLILNTDSHSPSDLITREEAERLARGAGLSQNACEAMFAEAEALARRLVELYG